MAGPQEPAQQVPFMNRVSAASVNQAALSRVFARLSAALPVQDQPVIASPGGAFDGDWSRALASQRSVDRSVRPGTARRETSPRKAAHPRGRSSSVDRRRMTSPARLRVTSPARLFGRMTSPSGRPRSAARRTENLEGFEGLGAQVKLLQQQCAAAGDRCRDLEADVRERDGEIRSLKARNAKLRSEKANERLKRQLSAVDQVLQPEDAAGARLEGSGFGKDHRLALLIKKVKALEDSREEALSLAERAQAAIVPVKEALENKAGECEQLEARCAAQAKELQRELVRAEKLEAAARAHADEAARAREQMERARGDFERVCAELDSVRCARAELLERNVKRDRKVDALQKKLKAVGEALEIEQKARAKSDDDLANLEDRMRTIRKRSAALEARCAQEKEQKEALARDVQMKEEECCLLVKMVNNPLAHEAAADAAASRRTEADTIAEQTERIKILLAEVSRLRFAAKHDSSSPGPETPNPASPFDNNDWALENDSDAPRAASAAGPASSARRARTLIDGRGAAAPPKHARRADATEAAARLARRKSARNNAAAGRTVPDHGFPDARSIMRGSGEGLASEFADNLQRDFDGGAGGRFDELLAVRSGDWGYANRAAETGHIDERDSSHEKDHDTHVVASTRAATKSDDVTRISNYCDANSTCSDASGYVPSGVNKKVKEFDKEVNETRSDDGLQDFRTTECDGAGSRQEYSGGNSERRIEEELTKGVEVGSEGLEAGLDDSDAELHSEWEEWEETDTEEEPVESVPVVQVVLSTAQES